MQGEHRVTWQPMPNVREASVVQSWGSGSDGTVVAGTSLARAEARSRSLLDVLAAGCRRRGQCRDGGCGQATVARIVEVVVAPTSSRPQSERDDRR